MLWAALIFAVSAQPNLPQAPLALLDVLLKKSAHLAEYAILAVLIHHALGPSPTAHRWPRLALAWVLATVYAATDELHQSFVPGRAATPLDVAIDAVGAFLGLAALQVAQRLRPRADGAASVAAVPRRD